MIMSQNKQVNKKIRVLFLSIKNDARSQMAEGFLKHMAPSEFEVFSAGMLPALELNPVAVQVMTEHGIDISKNTPKGLLNLLPSASVFNYIITICDEKEDIRCPAFSDKRTKKLHWNIENPDVSTSYEEKLNIMRKIRDEIGKKVKEFVKEVINS